jgi:hypothetical protein
VDWQQGNREECLVGERQSAVGVLRDEQIEYARAALKGGREAWQREARWRSACFEGMGGFIARNREGEGSSTETGEDVSPSRGAGSTFLPSLHCMTLMLARDRLVNFISSSFTFSNLNLRLNMINPG